MANTKSAIKEIRKNRKRRLHNREIRGRARTAVRHARELIDAGRLDEAQDAVENAYSALDKAAVKGVIHKNNAARRKSRLCQHLNRALQAE